MAWVRCMKRYMLAGVPSCRVKCAPGAVPRRTFSKSRRKYRNIDQVHITVYTPGRKILVATYQASGTEKEDVQRVPAAALLLLLLLQF